MTIEECYEALEGDYSQAKVRLHSDAIIKKFVLKFPAQCGYDALCKAVEEEDYKAAFGAAHTLKGVCMNLNFTKTWRVKFKAYRNYSVMVILKKSLHFLSR